jgi:hypothetical protein
MSTDPKPEKRFILKQGERSIAATNANRPQITDFLKSQGWMARVGAP